MTIGKSPKSLGAVVDRAATSISTALDRMVADLPESDAPQMALEQVVKELAVRHPFFMRLIMEDYDIREAYYDAVSLRPIELSHRGSRSTD